MLNINLEPYTTSLTWKEGEQHRFNHAKCPAGEDTRRRLYVKAVNPSSTWIAYCHNCGNSGASRRASGKSFNIHDALLERCETSGVTDTLNEHSNSILNIVKAGLNDNLSLAAKAWLYKCRLTDDDIKELGIKNFDGHVAIPINDRSWQVRFINAPTAHRYTNFYPKDEQRHYYIREDATVNILILTEDIISAYRVSKYSRCDAIACLGTNVPKNIDFSRYNGVNIWFDRDKAGQAGALKVGKEIRALCKNLYLIDAAEPKLQSDEDMGNIFASLSVKAL